MSPDENEPSKSVEFIDYFVNDCGFFDVYAYAVVSVKLAHFVLWRFCCWRCQSNLLFFAFRFFLIRRIRQHGIRSSIEFAHWAVSFVVTYTHLPSVSLNVKHNRTEIQFHVCLWLATNENNVENLLRMYQSVIWLNTEWNNLNAEIRNKL